MLYQWYETQRAFFAPFSEFASATAKLYNHPLSPFVHTPLAQRMSAGLDLIHRLAKDYEKPQFGINTAKVGGVEVAVQQQVALQKPFCRLLRFKRFTDNPQALETMKSQPTVLVVAPLSGHHATLLRDTVRALLPDHNVYITDWIDGRMVPMSHGPQPAAGPQSIHHRLDRRAHGAGRRWTLPSGRLRGLCAGVHSSHRQPRACDLGVPADGAGAGCGVVDGQ